MACKRANSNAEEFFNESFTRASLKSILSTLTLFPKFLNALQLEGLLSNSIIAQKHFGGEVDDILRVTSTSAQAAIGLRIVFQAMFNCFDSVLVGAGTKGEIANLPLVAIRFLNQLLTPILG